MPDQETWETYIDVQPDGPGTRRHTITLYRGTSRRRAVTAFRDACKWAFPADGIAVEVGYRIIEQ